jgi:Xaa-Pro aminopeptidase
MTSTGPTAGTKLSAHDHVGRRQRVRDELASRGASHLLVTDPRNVRYLTGFTGSNGQVLIGLEPAADRLITDARYDERAATEAPSLERLLDRDPIGAVLPLVSGGGAEGSLLLVEDHHLSWEAGRDLLERAEACGVEVAGAGRLVEVSRLIKDEAEIERIAEACRITQEGLEWLLTEVVGPGSTERELAVRLERRFIDSGADGIAFPSIVASGPNAAIPHHEPTDRQLRSGDLLTIDCGAMIDGYHADHTRTVAIGHLDEQLTRVHATVVAAQAAGIAAICPGAMSGEVDAAARAVVEEAGFGDAFVHGTGHGVGLAIHEAPAVARGTTATLRPGIVLTVEPGIYLSGLGGVRIEDTLVITADGTARTLTDTPRELRIL